MKIRKMVCLCTVAALPALALAELPVNGQALGSVQGTVDFCAQLDPASAATYQGFPKLIVQGTAEEEVEKVRRSDEYKEAYASVSAQLKDIPKEQAIESCKGFVEGKAG